MRKHTKGNGGRESPEKGLGTAAGPSCCHRPHLCYCSHCGQQDLGTGGSGGHRMHNGHLLGGSVSPRPPNFGKNNMHKTKGIYCGVECSKIHISSSAKT